MTDAPENGLGSAADVNFAVDRPDVGLHGVGAQVRQPCHIGIALALRDESEDLGLAVAESLAAAGPVKSDGAPCARWSVADYHLAGMDGLQSGDQVTSWQRLRKVAVGSVLPGAGDEIRMKVPGVHHDSTCAWIGHQLADLVVVRFGLGERVVQDDVDGVVDGHGGVDLGDDYAVVVFVEHFGDAHQHDVIVVDERYGDRLAGG